MLCIGVTYVSKYSDLALSFLSSNSLLRYCGSGKFIFGSILLDLYVAPFNQRREGVKETELRFRQAREEVKMKTLSLAAFVGCLLAICLAEQFDEIEDTEQFNSDLKETGDLPFQLSKEEG